MERRVTESITGQMPANKDIYIQQVVKHIRMIGEERVHIVVMAALLFAIYLFMLLRGWTRYCKINVRSVVTGLLLSLSIGAILALTLLGREYNPYGRNFELEVFWSYKKAFFEHSAGLAVEIMCNILLFVPWGFLLPLAFEKFENPWWTLSASLMLSGGIELFQGIFRLGLFEFDDMINNTIGAMTGFLLARLVFLVRTKSCDGARGKSGKSREKA